MESQCYFRNLENVFGKRFLWDLWSEALFLLFDKLNLTEGGGSGPPSPPLKKNLRMMLIEVFMLLFITFQ